MNGAGLSLNLGSDLALGFGLLFARSAGVIGALPTLLGVGLPIRVRMLLAAVIAGALLPLSAVAMPSEAGILPVVAMTLRELAIGLMLSFAAAVAVGAVITAGSVIAGGMELNSGAILRADVESPNTLSDGLGALAGMLFFVGGFHRMLIGALAHSVAVFPLGSIAVPNLHGLIAMGGRVFALAMGLAFPVLVPLFVLSIAQGVIARLAPQVNILTAAPAAIIMAGLMLLALDASGLGVGMMRIWGSVMTQATGWLDG